MTECRPVLFCKDGSGSIAAEGDTRTPFAWWRYTKTVLSICALQLVDSGKMVLDDLLPGQPFTLRQVLQNIAGIEVLIECGAFTVQNELLVHSAKHCGIGAD